MTDQGTYDLFGQFADAELEGNFQAANWARTHAYAMWICIIAASGFALIGAVHQLYPALTIEPQGLAAIWVTFGLCVLPLLFLKSPEQHRSLSWALLAAQTGIYGHLMMNAYMDAQSTPNAIAASVAMITLFILMLPGRSLSSVTTNVIALTFVLISLYSLERLDTAQAFRVAIVVYLMVVLCVLLRKNWNIIERDAFLEHGKLESSRDIVSESQAALEGVLSVATEGIIILDKDLNIYLFSQGAEHIFGRDAEEMAGTPVDQLIPARLRDAHRGNMQRFKEGSQKSLRMSARNGLVGLRKDGEEFPATVSVSKVEARGGHLYAVILRDISLEKSTQQNLHNAKLAAETADQAKSHFLATMSHELRTPLNAVIGFSEMMEQQVFGPLGHPKYASYATHIREAGTHLLTLISDILDLSKIEAGKEELFEQEVNVSETLRAAMQLMNAQAESAGVGLKLDVPESLPVLLADETKVKQILFNLMSNAIKFTAPGGKVTLKAYWSGGPNLILQIVDTGVGIAPEDISKALSAFQQVNRDTHATQEGTGLGLPLAKNLIELHGGSLDLQSERGFGTTVTVTFPAERIVGQTAERAEGAGLTVKTS